MIHSGASVPVQHDGEDLLAQVRRTLIGGAITGLSSVLEMTQEVLQQLDVPPGMRCLELGTGTGIAAGLLQHLAGGNGAVVSVETDPHLARAAQQRLATAGLDVEVMAGDGLTRCPRGALYDRIMSTFTVPRLPDAGLDQLADDGTL